MEGEGSVTTLTKKEANELLLNPPSESAASSEASLTNVTGKYHSLVIAKFIEMNIVEFSRINPNFDKLLAENGNFDLRLPADKLLLFQANKPKILEQSIQLLLTMDGK